MGSRRASSGSAGCEEEARGLLPDPGWTLHTQHPSLTPSITGDDEETEAPKGGHLSSSDPEPGGTSEPNGPGQGTRSTANTVQETQGDKGAMAGTQQAGCASWPSLPRELASQPSLHHASSPRTLAPCHEPLDWVSWRPPVSS